MFTVFLTRVLVCFFIIFSVSDILIDDPIRVGRPPYRTSHNYRPWRYEKRATVSPRGVSYVPRRVKREKIAHWVVHIADRTG